MNRSLSQISGEWYKLSVKEFGEDTAKKMWQRAKDPVTGYVAKALSSVHLLDGKIPCQRCGGFGMWSPEGGVEEKEVLCLKCHDDWAEACRGLLRKHGYVSSKKKWHSAFLEFCSSALL